MASVNGFTKDVAGNLLPSATCSLFKDNLDGTCSFIQQVTSNAVTAAYHFDAAVDSLPQYFVVSWKDDTPHVFDCTDHVLQPLADSGSFSSVGTAAVAQVGLGAGIGGSADAEMDGTSTVQFIGQGNALVFMDGTGDMQFVGGPVAAGAFSATGTGDFQITVKADVSGAASMIGTGDLQFLGQGNAPMSIAGVGDLQMVAPSGIAPTVGNVTSNFTVDATGTKDMAMAGNVTAGRLIVFSAFEFETLSIVAFTAGMLTKVAGTATIGTVQLDTTIARADGAGSNRVGIWTIPITGSGSLTLRLASGAVGDTFISLVAFEADLIDVSATRINGSASANSSTNTAIASGNVATGGAGIIVGVMAPGNPYGTITLTPDAAFTTAAELEDDSEENGALIYRLVTSDTTDSADSTAGTSCAWCAAAIAIKAATP